MVRQGAAALLTTFMVMLALVALASPAGAVIEDPDVDTVADYEYRVLPEDGAVDVTIRLAVTADKPNQTNSDGSYYEYFFQGYFLAVPEEAENVIVADDAGRELAYEVDDSVPGVEVLDISFRRNIFYRQTANLVVSYRLPAGAARSDALTRVNEAYAGFEIWLTPQLEEASVTVITPSGFDDRSTGSEPFRMEIVDGERQFIAEDVDPEDYWALASMARDESLTTTEVEIDDHTIEISAWPGDDVWAEHVASNLEEGLPTLIDQVGLPWPVDDELEIIESYSPYLIGYAGWYDPNTVEIEIGDQLDSHLVFHELSHVWFNDELFDQRWITEGLADVFGAAVVESLGDEPEEPEPTSPNDSEALPLNQWTTYGNESDTESWSYGASWTVTSAIVDEVGLDALSAAIQAADNDHISYLGDAAPEDGPVRQDWRLYLDLIENHGEVTDDAITSLFSEWILLDSQLPSLETRAASRTTYASLGDAGESWAAPYGVRDALSDWRFPDADELMSQADQVLSNRDLVLETLAPLGATLPDALEETYEATDDDFTEVTKLMSEATVAAEHLNATDQGIRSVSGPLQWAGGIGTDYPADLSAAVTAFEDGNLPLATERTVAIDDDIEQLTRRGAFRIGAAVAVVLVLLLGIILLVRWRRKKRRRRASEAVPMEASMAEASQAVSPEWDPPTPVS